MTRPGIEPWSPGPLANTLTARPMSGVSSSGIIFLNELKNIKQTLNNVFPDYIVDIEIKNVIIKLNNIA